MHMRPARSIAACVTGRAVMLDRFGGPDELRLRDHRWSLALAADEVIVRNLATSVNPIEWKMREGLGLPHGLWRRWLSDPIILGLDFAGEVIAAGPASGFSAGERVMGALPLDGAYADYVRVRTRGRGAIARLPGGIDAETAALLPFAGLVALAGLDALAIAGRRVLVIGATGGVGHLAVQIARALGASSIAAICGSRNVDFARDLGAGDALSYASLTAPGDILHHRPDWRDRFDLILDTSGVDAYYVDAASALLSATGQFVSVALPTFPGGRPGEAVGPIEAGALAARLIRRRLGGRFRLVTGLLGGLGGSRQLDRLAHWMAAGQVVPHAGASFTLEQLADAHRLIERGGTRGKIAVSLSRDVRSHA